MARKYPSQTQRRREAAAQLRLQKIHITRLQRLLQAELLRTVRSASASYPRWQHVIQEHRHRLGSLLIPALRTAAMSAAHHQRQIFRKSFPDSFIESKGDNELPTDAELDAEIASMITQRAMRDMWDISRTTERRIKNCIKRGLAANESTDEIGQRIFEEVGGMVESQAYAIARTEVGVASATAVHAEMDNAACAFGVTLVKIWTATEDDRTRESHSEADGQVVGMDEPFEVGESELMFPSDPDGPPEEVINCRCVCKYEIMHGEEQAATAS